MNTQPTPESILRQIAQIQHMERGKLCLLRQGPNGPYYNHQAWEEGRNVSRYVAREKVETMQEAIAGYQQFQRLVEEYARLIIGKTRTEMATGVKKKHTPPRSSWPKTRKSSS